MEIYLECAKLLDELLVGARAVRISVPEYLPLSIEEIGVSQDGHRLVSLCQYGEQNGDLMRDCDLVFMVSDLPDGVAAEPVSFRNDYLRIVQDVYRYDEAGKRTQVVSSLKQELKEFAQAWLATLREQGFFARRRFERSCLRKLIDPFRGMKGSHHAPFPGQSHLESEDLLLVDARAVFFPAMTVPAWASRCPGYKT